MKKVLAARMRRPSTTTHTATTTTAAIRPGDVLAYYDECGAVRAHASVLDEQGRLESFSLAIDAQTGSAKRVALSVYESPADWLRSFVSRRERLDAEALRRRLHAYRITSPQC